MKINVLEQSEKKLKIELRKESATFANLLKKELWKSGTLDFAAVVKKHPYMSEPELTIKMLKGTPEKALNDAVESLIDQVKNLKKQAAEYVK